MWLGRVDPEVEVVSRVVFAFLVFCGMVRVRACLEGDFDISFASSGSV